MTTTKNRPSAFNLDDFSISASPLNPHAFSVGIPSTAFQVRRSTKHQPPLCVYIALIEGQWWLVHKHVAKKMYLSSLYQAELYFVIRGDGSYGLLPVTLPKNGFTSSWYDAWQNHVQLAEGAWVVVESDRQSAQHIATRVRCDTRVTWPEMTDGEWIERAFDGRVIDSLQHPLAKRHPAREMYDPIVEEF